MQQRHIASHTGLRGIAALLVVFYHLQFGTTSKLSIETVTALPARSYLLVDLFFILSGFIISYTATPVSGRFTRPEAMRFLRARIARIWPLHAFCLVYLTAFLFIEVLIKFVQRRPVGDPRWSAEGALYWLQEFFLVHAWGIGETFAWNTPSWSISAELAAYLLFPLLIAIAIWPLGLASMVLLAAAFFMFIGLTTGNLDITRGMAPLRCLAGFILGLWLYRVRGRISALPEWSTSIVQLLAVFTAISMLAITVNDVLIIPAFLVLVGSTWGDKGIVAQVLRARPFQFLGEISYSVYLNHVCLIQILNQIWVRTIAKSTLFPVGVQRVLWIALIVLATIAISTLTFRYVEQPARRFLTQRSR